MSWETFFTIPKGVTLWDVINSNAVAVLLGAYLTYALTALAGRTRAAEEKASGAVKKAEDAQATAEDAESLVEAVQTAEERELELAEREPVEEAEQADEPEEDLRGEATELVQRARAFLQRKMDDDPDQRHQRTYQRISGHRPTVRAVALFQRGQLTANELSAVLQIFHLWNRYARGHVAHRPVPRDVHNEIAENLAMLGI
jgi:hypothetical protein